MAVPDEYLAFNGTTVGGQIDNLKREEEGKEKVRERDNRDRDRDREKKEATGRPPPLKKQQSTKQYKMVPNYTSAWNGTQSVPLSRAASPPSLPSLPTVEKGAWGEKKRGGRGRGLGKRKSFFNFWGSGRRDGGGGG